MPPPRPRWAAEPTDNLIAAEAPIGDPTAVPLAAGAFLVGWVLIGVGAGLVLARRGHDRRLMVALGAGLGPLMLALAPETVASEGDARPMTLAAGRPLRGVIDVLVLVPDEPADVVAALPNLEAVAPAMRTLTMGRVLPYESFGPSSDDGVVDQAFAALEAARDAVGFPEAALVAYPGSAEAVARSFHADPGRTLVLLPAAESPPEEEE